MAPIDDRHDDENKNETVAERLERARKAREEQDIHSDTTEVLKNLPHGDQNITQPDDESVSEEQDRPQEPVTEEVLEEVTSSEESTGQELASKSEETSKELANPKSEEPKPMPVSVAVIRGMRQDIDNLVIQINNGEFSTTGVGELGLMYQSISEEPAENLSIVWGEIISLCATLWEKGYMDEATALFQTAKRDFYVPEDMQEQVENASKLSQNYQATQEAEKAFALGANEEAISIAQSIQGSEEGAAYVEDLSTRINKRKKSRKIAYAVSAVAVMGLITMSYISIQTLERVFQDPPTPSFQDFTGNLESVSEDLRNVRESRSTIHQTPRPDVEANPVEGQGAPTNVDPNLEQQQTETQAPTEQDIQARQSCHLGYAVYLQGEQMINDNAQAPINEKLSQQRNLANFAEQLTQSCSQFNMSVEEIQQAIEQMDSQEVFGIAQRIVNTPPSQ